MFFFVFTQVIQVPQGKYKVLPTERTKVSSYPVALIPGQFQEYYKRYSGLSLTTGTGFGEGLQSLGWRLRACRSASFTVSVA